MDLSQFGMMNVKIYTEIIKVGVRRYLPFFFI